MTARGADATADATSPARAVILAAGQGTRLRASHDLPKCLLDLGGTTLLDRYVYTLDALGCQVTVVTGYRDDAVRARLAALSSRHAAAALHNERYHEGSILSLARALREVAGPLLVLDGDVLFHPSLLQRLVAAPHTDALLVDVGTSFTTEEYMAGVDAGRITELRRGPVAGHDASGEWVGFARLSARSAERLRAAIEQQIAAGHTRGGYEDALASILPDVDMRCMATDGLPWIEIDFPEDLARAAALILDGAID